MLALLLIGVAFQSVKAQSDSAPFSFRAGQSMYIVAFRRTMPVVSTDASGGNIYRPDYYDYDLDAERKVRKRIEEWRFFKVVDKPSEADFVFFINVDDASIEGLVLSFEDYRQHFKEKLDLDALREAAHGRYLIGPLKLPTISRLSDRLIKQFREKLSKGS